MPSPGKGNNVIRTSSSAKGVVYLYGKTGTSDHLVLVKLDHLLV
jgi:hypothetical protein